MAEDRVEALEKTFQSFAARSPELFFEWKEDFLYGFQYFRQGWSESARDPRDVHKQTELCFQCKRALSREIYR